MPIDRPIARAASRALMGLALAGLACGESEESRLGRRPSTVAELPENVLGAAKQRLAGVEFTDVWKNVNADGSLHSYEIRGKAANGKIREVRVGTDGSILEEE